MPFPTPDNNGTRRQSQWITLGRSATFLFSKKQLLGLSLILFLVTALLTWLGYQLSIDFLDSLTKSYLPAEPAATTLIGWIKHKGWMLLMWLYLIITRIAAFYLSFILAYTLTSPGYVLLSTATEKLHLGEDFEMDEGFTLRSFLLDILEGLKIAAFGILVTIAALAINFVPIIGQFSVIMLYIFYSALMFIDYPASRRRWSLGKKLRWLGGHTTVSLRLGILPALISMMPLINIFFMAVLFPFLTVHATLNFTNIEKNTNMMEKPYGH